MKRTLILFTVFLIFCGCSRPALVKKTRSLLGTYVEISVADQDKPRQTIELAIDQAFGEMERVEVLLSRFESTSDISRINNRAYLEPVRVSPETIALIEKSIKFSQLSDGAFDITIAPLMQSWGLTGGDEQGIPSAEQIKQVLDKVGYQHVDVIKQGQLISLARQGMNLDLGGLAKGYAVDRAIVVLKQQGIRNALVNAGGDIYGLGRPDKMRRWSIGIQHPRKREALLTKLEIEDKAVATSGDYQKYITIGDRNYSHIINPKSGYPCEEVPASVTTLAEDCLSADALATAVFVLGPDKGINLVDRLNDTEAVAISFREGRLDIMLSQGLKGELEINR